MTPTNNATLNNDNVKGGSVYNKTALDLWDAQHDWIRYLAWGITWDQQMIYLKVKSNRWKSCAEVTCEAKSKNKSV